MGSPVSEKKNVSENHLMSIFLDLFPEEICLFFFLSFCFENLSLPVSWHLAPATAETTDGQQTKCQSVTGHC